MRIQGYEDTGRVGIQNGALSAIYYGILNGIMDATVEIDKAGRIVVPKKMREALHLSPGTRLKVQQTGDVLVLEPDYPDAELVMRDGMWVMRGGQPSSVDIPELIRQTYEERHKRIMEGSGLE